MLNSLKAALLLFVFSCLLFSYLQAQEGYSSAAMSMSQQKAGQLILPKSNEIIEEEYFNYHIHKLPRPSTGQLAHLDAQWLPLNNQRTLLQVGISTVRLEEMEAPQSVNINLLVDKSGSMSYEDKLVKSKQALLTFVDQLQPTDRVSLVTFDHEAQLIFKAQAVGDGQQLKAAINSIQLGGSTNMPLGIQTAYQAILQGAQTGRDNRMIILTDALTNTGTIDPEAIVKATDGYRQDVPLSFSLIGVGIDFNHELTRLMTANGRDQVHFISNIDHINKIFVHEVESLLYPIGRKPILDIELPAGVKIEKVYGYLPSTSNRNLNLRLRDFNAGLSQVVLIELSGSTSALGQAQINLTYQQPGQGATRQMKAQLYAAKQTQDLQKNHAIAQMAASLKTMAEQYENGNAQAAEDALDIQIGTTKQNFPAPRDPDLERMLNILEDYRKNVRQLAQR